MSRSVKRRSYGTYVGPRNGQKKAKQAGNRSMRRATRTIVHVDAEEGLYPQIDVYMNVYDMPQDGSRFYAPFDERRAGRMTYRFWYKWLKAK